MLTIRYLRAGRRNQAFFRVVLTDSTKPPKSGFIKVLGWYDPHTKVSSLQKEEILSWLDKGAKPSNSLAKLLEENKIKHKLIKFVKNAPAKAKKEQIKEDKPATKEEKVEEKAEEVTEESMSEAKETVEPATKIAEIDETSTEAVKAEATKEVEAPTEV